jgi:ribosome-associated heat shock protein Hsp15
MRVDKFMWAVRLFKTRSKATESCNAGKVEINEHYTKPSKDVKVGDILTIRIGPLTKTVKIKDLLKNRVSAALVPNYIVDLTPQEEYDKMKSIHERFEWRDRGTGRPEKKDRRLIDKLKRDDKFRL